MIAYEDAPFRPFHARLVAAGTGGQLADGFSLGIIGIALSLAIGPLHLDIWWIATLGAASLVGLFVGCLVAGTVTDAIGRRKIFAWDMLVFAGLSAAQFFVQSPAELLILRTLLGVALGADYVVSKSLIFEFSPIRIRGRLLSVLSVAWAAGYVAAYCVGYLLRDIEHDAWRWTLLSSAVPSLLIFWFRLRVPESPLWLVGKGRIAEARAIIDRHIGRDVALPLITPRADGSGMRSLFAHPYRRNVAVGCIFYTCQVIPFFAIGTYLPSVLKSLGVHDGYTSGLIFNALLMIGAIFGLLIVDRIARRTFLIGSFLIMSALLALLVLWSGMPPILIVPLFAAFAFILAASVNLEFVYPPELFPTELRATGVGLVVACSRFGSAFSTFALPLVVERLGIYFALGTCVIVMLFAAITCFLWAPETRYTVE
jgi:putative MFS transporter